MNTLEIRHEIATLRAAMLEIVHRLEKLSKLCESLSMREVVYTRRVTCDDCGRIENHRDLGEGAREEA